MSGSGRELHVESPAGALLTRFWAGHYKRSFSPLTHAVMAAKSPGGLLLVRPASRTAWHLPGGARSTGERSVDCAARRLKRETGLVAQRPAVIGYYRLVVAGRVEYGALAVCRVNEPNAQMKARLAGQVRTWDCSSILANLDPIAAALAVTAAKSTAWRLS